MQLEAPPWENTPGRFSVETPRKRKNKTGTLSAPSPRIFNGPPCHRNVGQALRGWQVQQAPVLRAWDGFGQKRKKKKNTKKKPGLSACQLDL